jgi:hypothetical protein
VPVERWSGAGEDEGLVVAGLDVCLIGAHRDLDVLDRGARERRIGAGRRGRCGPIEANAYRVVRSIRARRLA